MTSTPAEKQRRLTTRPRVLVVEDEEAFRMIHEKNLRDWGYEPFVAQGQGQDLLADAVRLANLHRCHFALVDLHLLDNYDPDDESGLELIPQLKPTEAIIVTGSRDPAKSTDAIKHRGARHYLLKREKPAVILEGITEVAEELCACKSGLAVEWGPNWSSAAVSHMLLGKEDPRIPEEQSDDILLRLFPGSGERSLRVNPYKETRATTSSVIRPHSIVLLAHLGENQPEMVKLARAAKVSQEASNYDTYIPKAIAGRYRPTLESRCILWDLGGARYTFLGSEGLYSFAETFQQASPGRINQILTRFFTEIWAAPYREAQKPSMNLLDAYCRVLGRDWYERMMETDFNHRAEFFGAGWKAGDLPNPLTWLKEKAQDPCAALQTEMAVTHGDLHGDNLLIDNNNIPWVIDFERTGPGPILQDFVELESDIASRMASSAIGRLETACRLWALIAGPKTLGESLLPPGRRLHGFGKTLQVIAHLRSLAAESCGCADARPYVWGLLINALFRAHLLRKVSRQEEFVRTLLQAAIFCHRLEHWEDASWPPENWNIFC